MSASTTSPSHGPVTIAVTSGKGGVGKTNVVVNLAVALARLRHRVVVLDADFGLGNVDVLLGLAPPFHIGHLLTGERTLSEIMVRGPLGIQVIPASSGIRELAALTPRQRKRLTDALQELGDSCDFLLIDTAAGISNNVIETVRGAQLALIVTSVDPTAVVDAYAMLKLLTKHDAGLEIGLVVNDARDVDDARLVHTQLDIASTRFLQRGLQYYGHIVHDQTLRDAVLVQRPVVDHVPQAPSSRCFRTLACRLSGMRHGGPGLRVVSTPRVASPTTPLRMEALRCA
ncbi:MAG: MinD/ParA family protein [Acidobacteria bacterium]|jgi:flagellar biosynthesis protein FlhG|nr:MinD/ParA family protein [Acidobacteriota bacterium]